MKKHIINISIFLNVGVILCLTPLFLIGQNEWNQKTDFGGSRRKAAVSFSINGSVFIGTGYDSLGFRKDFWRWDQVTDTWSQIADFGGTARYKAVAFTINGKAYVGTGVSNSGNKKDFWEYDPITDSWVRIADFQYELYGATGISIMDKGYIGLGSPDFLPLNHFWEYDPLLDKWSRKKDYGGLPRAYAVGFSINDKGYIGTGLDVSMEGYASDFWEYNPHDDSWIQITNFGDFGVSNAVSCSINNKGYIGTGQISGATKENFFWEFSPTIGVDEYPEISKLNISPNPFTSSTTISFQLKQPATVQLNIFDHLGAQVYFAQQHQQEGEQKLQWNATDMPSGIYYYRLQVGEEIKSGKLIKIY